MRPQESPLRHLELKIPPLAMCAACALVIFALSYFFPYANVPFAGHRVISIALILVGVAVAAAGVVQFHFAKTTVNPMVPSRASSVVDSGVFRVSRNPMYLGMALALLGLSAWHGTIAGYALVPLFCIYMTWFQIKPEERALLALFGDEFARYKLKVRRWI